MKRAIIFCGLFCGVLGVAQGVVAHLTPFNSPTDAAQIELKNDSWNAAGGSTFQESGFVAGEKAGVWVKVPANVSLFKTDSFRVLFSGGADGSTVQLFFSMAYAENGLASNAIPEQLTNAAQLTSGPYWNDIPAQGASGASAITSIPCLKAGALVAGALEFAQGGLPSVSRDSGPLNVAGNVLFAVPGGWNFSQAYGLTGNWILRIVGHEATAAECQ